MPAPKSDMLERHAMAQALIDWFRSQGISRDDAVVAMSMVIAAIPMWEKDEKQGRN